MSEQHTGGIRSGRSTFGLPSDPEDQIHVPLQPLKEFD